MAYLVTHFYAGGTEEQYRAVLSAAHPADGLPPGQTYHAAGPTEDGWLIVAVWDSKDAFDAFVTGALLPTLGRHSGGFTGPPQERAGPVVNLETA